MKDQSTVSSRTVPKIAHVVDGKASLRFMLLTEKTKLWLGGPTIYGDF